MIETILFFIHYGLLLLFGIVLSCAFAGVRFAKRNIAAEVLLFVFCGLLQIIAYITCSNETLWKIYPLIAHLPVLILLCIYFRKRLSTAISAICSAYMFCQPAKWFGLLSEAIAHNITIGYTVRIITLIGTGFLFIRYVSPYISEIFNKDTRSVAIFSMVPTVYYIFDYSMSIYTDFWKINNRTAIEFLPFFLCIVYMLFCLVYYKEQEQKADAERKKQIIDLTVEQQKKELSAIAKSEHEIRILRHDMRLILNNLALYIENNDTENAMKMISGFVSEIDSTSIKRFCSNDTLNYIFSAFDTKCHDMNIRFNVTVSISDLNIDEIIFSSIVSNALDNAINAQKDLPESNRSITVILKNTNDKLLLSVENPFSKAPVFIDGLPVSDRKGHGYGSQSIRYMTERLKGNCRFSVQDNCFLLRVII